MNASTTAALFNFRDFGGLAVGAGGHVVNDRLFRSGHHADLSETSRDALLACDFAVVADLRYPDERAKDVSPWPAHWSNRVLARDASSGMTAPHIALLSAAADGVEAVHRAYCNLYAGLPFDPVYRQLFGEGLSRIACTEGRVLIHCSAGKDRTGVFVALLLDLLGVPRNAITADYLQSAGAPALVQVGNDVARRLTHEGVEDASTVAAALVGVRDDYLAAMFAAIDTRYGNAETYFREGGLSPEMTADIRDRLIAR